MSLPTDALRLEVLALQPALRTFADSLTDDDGEALELVHLTMLEALGEQPDGDVDEDRNTRVWLYGILRGAFHSVARRRALRRTRGSPGGGWNAGRAAVFAAGPEAAAAPTPEPV